MVASEFRLDGLEPDNLLAFLSLLGTLRALERVRPAWNARASWVGLPMRPELRVTADVGRDDVVRATAEGVDDLAQELEFDGYLDLKFSASVCRAMLENAVTTGIRDRERLYAALMTDGATKKDGTIATPPLCTMLGQGHQHFLQRLVTVGRGEGGSPSVRNKPSVSLRDAAYFERALFAAWSRSDMTDSFRWDPAEDRRYALRDVNPSGDPGRTEHGANRLAIAALPLFSSVPTGRGGSAAITTIAFSRGADRRRRITWPIWNRWLDIRTVLALMTRPGLHRDVPSFAEFRSSGVIAAFRSYRVENGYFANFTAAEAFALTE